MNTGSAGKNRSTCFEDRLLDPEKLESIRSLTDESDSEDFLASLIQMFFDRTPKLINEIQLGISKQDAQQLEQSSHALKGTAGNIGAYPLMKVCEQLEERGRLQDFSDVDELETELQDLFSATANALRAELDQQGESA